MNVTGIATDEGKIEWLHGHAAKLVAYLKKKPGQFILFDVKPAYKSKGNPKTASQLGYYWALLLPEIHVELIRQGWTRTVSGTFKKSGEVISREVKIDQDDAHDEIKRLCALVDSDGKFITLGDMDKFQCMKFLDNVFNFAGELDMDVEVLKATMELAKKLHGKFACLNF